MKTVKVPSSSGRGEYTVTAHSDGRLSCTCPGYMMRRTCRHITDESTSKLLSEAVSQDTSSFMSQQAELRKLAWDCIYSWRRDHWSKST